MQNGLCWISAESVCIYRNKFETLKRKRHLEYLGVNSHKPGRKSYHPLLTFEGQTRLHLNEKLCPGNTLLNRRYRLFAANLHTARRMQSRVRPIRSRFGGEDFYYLWESRKIGYVGKMKWTQRLASEVAACCYWARYVDESWTSSASP